MLWSAALLSLARSPRKSSCARSGLRCPLPINWPIQFWSSMIHPTLELHDSNGALLEASDNWVDNPNKQAIIDSTIPPTNNLESAIVRTLAPANYTAIVRGAGNTTGIAVVEVYALN